MKWGSLFVFVVGFPFKFEKVFRTPRNLYGFNLRVADIQKDKGSKITKSDVSVVWSV